MKLRGRIDTDSLWVVQSAASEAIVGHYGDVTGLRRARVGAEGKFDDWGRYVTEIDVATGEVVPQDVFVGLGNQGEEGEFRCGHFREPFNLEGYTSARFLPFIERSPAGVFDPVRNWGLGWFATMFEQRGTWAVVAAHAGDGPGDFASGAGSTVDFTERLTYAPVVEDSGRRLLHFGLALSERLPEHGEIDVAQRQQSLLLDVDNPPAGAFSRQIKIPANYQQLVNLQAAAVRDGWWAQAEWYGSWIDQPDAGAVFYHGCYAAGGWFLTGEHRLYSKEMGTFRNVEVRRPFLRGSNTEDRSRGPGAWELTTRFAWLDTVDGNAPLGSNGFPQGQQLPQFTCGVNWYLSDYVRLMFNYSYESPVYPDRGTGVGQLLAARLAVWW
ncbi:MAG: hypothetical protein K1X74_06860 [Pirellulales bacterium]|nr:hypothetical protein [Pirellulales bacterium]